MHLQESSSSFFGDKKTTGLSKLNYLTFDALVLLSFAAGFDIIKCNLMLTLKKVLIIGLYS